MSSQAPAAQVVLRNVAELAQRQQSREMGSSLARQIFRLLKVGQFHSLDNMAFIQQLDQTVEALKAFGNQTGEALTLLFAKSTVFVCGQLLKASRSEYESALELSEMVRHLGVTQMTIQNDADRADLTALARLFQPGSRVKAEHGVLQPSPRVRLRYVSAARLDEDEQNLTPEDQVLRTYATTVVVMRRVYENLLAGRYQLPNQAKRLAQRLVALSEGDTPAFLGVTAMRNLNHDAAGRSVNRSILAVAMGRQLTGDLATLSRIAMSALFYDVATPLVSGVAGRGDQVVVARMTEQAERRLPAATAAVLTALGQLREASLVRTVIAYEAHWLRQLAALGPIYDGAHRPMVAARIVAMAHRFNVLMEPDLAASTTPTVDDAIAKLRAEARDTLDQAMLVLLIGALGVFPRGTPVELSTGERGVVLRTPDNPAHYAQPSVRLVYNASGELLRMKVALDLAGDPDRQVVSVITAPDPALAEACRAVEQAAAKAPALPSESVAPEPDLSSPLLDHQQNLVPTVPPPTPAQASARPRLASEPQPSSRPVERAVLEPMEPEPPVLEPMEPEPPVLEPPVLEPDETEPPPSSSTPVAGIRVRRRSRLAIEETSGPTSRRDPRSEDWEPDAVPAAPLERKPSIMGMRLSRRPASVPPVKGSIDDLVPDTDEIVTAEPSDPSSHWRRAPAALPQTDGVASRGLVDQTHAPSASGSLERTPFSHVLLYILDRAVGGTLILTEPADRPEDEPLEHAVYFQDGIPIKAHTGTRVAAFAPMLVAYGVLEQTQLENDPITQPPIHEATLESELIEFGMARPENLAEVRNDQLAERLCFLFGLPPATRYAFYNGFDLLQAIWGNVPGAVSPLATLTRGLREHPEEDAMDRVLLKLSGYPLHLHEETDVDAFGFTADEMAVAAAIAADSASLPDLIERGHDPDAVRRVLYALLLTHCIAPMVDELVPE